MRYAALLLLFVTACVARPNRTEPKWTVTPAMRAAVPLTSNDTVVPEQGTGCGERELLRVKNLGATVERELWGAGYEFPKATEEAPMPDDHVEVTVEVAKLDCTDALTGDLSVALARDGVELERVRLEQVNFSNFRVAANRLVDELLLSERLAAPIAPISTSSTSTTAG